MRPALGRLLGAQSSLAITGRKYTYPLVHGWQSPCSRTAIPCASSETDHPGDRSTRSHEVQTLLLQVAAGPTSDAGNTTSASICAVLWGPVHPVVFIHLGGWRGHVSVQVAGGSEQHRPTPPAIAHAHQHSANSCGFQGMCSS